MQREDIKKVLSGVLPEDTDTDALDKLTSGLLNLFHGELTAAKKASEEAAQKAAQAEEKAAAADEKDAEVAELRGIVDKLTAQLTEAARKTNLSNAVSKLKEAGMSAELAAAVAATLATDDEKATSAAVEAIVNSYAEQEKSRAAEAAKNGMMNMPFATPEGKGGAKDTPAVELAKKLGKERAVPTNGNSLADFAK